MSVRSQIRFAIEMFVRRLALLRHGEHEPPEHYASASWGLIGEFDETLKGTHD